MIYGKKFFKKQQELVPVHFSLHALENDPQGKKAADEALIGLQQKLGAPLAKAAHFSLIDHPSWRVSKSHTSQMGAAVLRNDDSISLGLDLERVTRVPRLDIKRRIAHPQDGNWDDLSLWVLKEACFKALSPLVDSQLSFSQICIQQDRAFYLDYVCQIQIWKQDYLSEQFLMALAFIELETKRSTPFEGP